MKTGAWVSAAVLCTALLGCATNPPGHDGSGGARAMKAKQVNCKRADACAVNVWVECPPMSLRCTIKVDNEFIVVFKNVKPDIAWNITAPDDPQHPTDRRFRFASNGIVFAGDTAGEFTGCRSTAGDRKFGCKDNQTNAEPVVWKYIVNIVDADGLYRVEPLDPWVIND